MYYLHGPATYVTEIFVRKTMSFLLCSKAVFDNPIYCTFGIRLDNPWKAGF